MSRELDIIKSCIIDSIGVFPVVTRIDWRASENQILVIIKIFCWRNGLPAQQTEIRPIYEMSVDVNKMFQDREFSVACIQGAYFNYRRYDNDPLYETIYKETK